jgi:hypothetical protein
VRATVKRSWDKILELELEQTSDNRERPVRRAPPGAPDSRFSARISQTFWLHARGRARELNRYSGRNANFVRVTAAPRDIKGGALG